MEEIFAILFIFGLVGLAIGNTKNRAGLGLILGFFIGPIGWLIVLLMSKKDE